MTTVCAEIHHPGHVSRPPRNLVTFASSLVRFRISQTLTSPETVQSQRPNCVASSMVVTTLIIKLSSDKAQYRLCVDIALNARALKLNRLDPAWNQQKKTYNPK